MGLNSRCCCCGRLINAEYRYCIGCERKRLKVYGDCIAGGMAEVEARIKVDSVYPCRYPDKDIVFDRLGRAYELRGDRWIRKRS
jgi:hypothetical protein